MQLLSDGTSNNKTKKNESITYILYLAPHKNNSKSINICPKATETCIVACLFYSGYASIFPMINERRKVKTEYYINNKIGFLSQLKQEIEERIKKSGDKKIIFRLNGTSDLDFLSMLKKVGFDFEQTPSNVFFYDYTKIKDKVKKYQYTDKYILTFSRSGENEKEVLDILKSGGNVSIVYSGKMPKTYLGYNVIDGDISDEEMFKYKSTIIALKVKGNNAKKMKNSFILE